MNSKTKKKKIKFKKGFKITVLVFLLIIITLSTTIYLLTPVSSSTKKEIITIESGTSTKEIATILKNKKLIKSKTFFAIYSKIKKANYYAASYEISPNMSLNEIIKELQTNGTNINEVTITIKEGQNMRQIAKLISENTSIKYDDIINLQLTWQFCVHSSLNASLHLSFFPSFHLPLENSPFSIYFLLYS